MAAISVRDIPEEAWEAFKAAAQAEGLPAEAKVRHWIIQESQKMDSTRLVWKAQRLHRADGELLHGSLTFRMCVANRDWEAVRDLAPRQQDGFHGTSVLDAADWDYLRSEAAKDGVEL